MTSISDPVALHGLRLKHCWIPMRAILTFLGQTDWLNEISRLF